MNKKSINILGKNIKGEDLLVIKCTNPNREVFGEVFYFNKKKLYLNLAEYFGTDSNRPNHYRSKKVIKKNNKFLFITKCDNVKLLKAKYISNNLKSSGYTLQYKILLDSIPTKISLIPTGYDHYNYEILITKPPFL